MNPARVIIATPTDGAPPTAMVTHAYHCAVRQLERGGAVVIPAEICFSDDLARARSRCVWYALTKPDWNWLLFWDDDVAPKDPSLVPRMIARAQADGHDILAAPYPRKRIPAQFPYKPMPEALATGNIQVHNDCVEVEMIAIGFCLISRSCLERMTAHYAHEWFTDVHDETNVHETVALFKQVHTDETTIPDGKGGTMRFRELYSEDYSFMHRWRAMGGKVQMYVGAATPLAHVGGHAYTGGRDELGRVR